jgi:Oxidoreductase molybdopterin binding domain
MNNVLLSLPPSMQARPRPFRRMLRFNERLEQNFFSERRPAAVVTDHLVQSIRTNGLVGLSGDYDPGQWQLNIDQGHRAVTSVTLDEIRALPRIEQTTHENGAPLRLRIPTKYGIKNIKRIGTITYTDQRPADYWAEQGYDWYAGL